MSGLLRMKVTSERLSLMLGTLVGILILLFGVGLIPWLQEFVVIARPVLIFALPLDFHGRLRFIRSMFIPGALHGIEASFLAEASLRTLRTAIVKVVWSRRQFLAIPVLSLLDGPSGCDCVLRCLVSVPYAS